MLEDYQDKMNCSDWIFNELQVRHHSDFGSVDDSLVKEEISQVLAFYVVRAGEPCDAQEQHLEPPPPGPHGFRRVARVRALRRVLGVAGGCGAAC